MGSKSPKDSYNLILFLFYLRKEDNLIKLNKNGHFYWLQYTATKMRWELEETLPWEDSAAKRLFILT